MVISHGPCDVSSTPLLNTVKEIHRGIPACNSLNSVEKHAHKKSPEDKIGEIHRRLHRSLLKADSSVHGHFKGKLHFTLPTFPERPYEHTCNHASAPHTSNSFSLVWRWEAVHGPSFEQPHVFFGPEQAFADHQPRPLPVDWSAVLHFRHLALARQHQFLRRQWRQRRQRYMCCCCSG